MNEFIFKSYDNSRQSISYCEVDKFKKVIDLREQLVRKEQECEELKESLKVWKYSDVQHIFKINKYEQTLAEIKEIVEKSCCLQPTSTCEEYENCKECSRTSDDETVKQIIQKISECEVENEV